MPNYTTPQLAAALGITEGRVRQIAIKEKIGHHFGRDWQFTQKDLEKIKGLNKKPGRPGKER